MKKDIVQTAKIIFLGAILSLGISFVSAEPWATPAGSPPGSNLGQVLNVMSASQSKDGAFAVGYDVGDEDDDGDYDSDDVDLATGTGVGYKLDVNGAAITQGLISQGPIISYGSIFAGVLPLDSSVNVLVGGSVGIGTTNPQESLHIASTGGTIRARGLSAEENAGVSYNAALCADENGTIILCDGPFSASITIDSQTTTTLVPYCLDKKDFSVTVANGIPPYTYDWEFIENESGNYFDGGTTSDNVTVYGGDDYYPGLIINLGVTVEDSTGNTDTATVFTFNNRVVTPGIDC
jgi:hypothetical protein